MSGDVVSNGSDGVEGSSQQQQQSVVVNELANGNQPYSSENGGGNNSERRKRARHSDASAGCGGGCTLQSSLAIHTNQVKIKSPTDRDIIRLIGQHLRGLGLNHTVEQLIRESGCKLDHPSASKFQSHVMEGDWNKAESDLHELKTMLEHPNALVEMRFLILEQKFLEYLDDNRYIDALHCLRNELTPLNHRIKRVHELSRFIMCSPGDELRKLSQWDGKGLLSRQKLMEKLQIYLPPTVMLPPRRLRTLLCQAIESQKERCPYHNNNNDKGLDCFSLLVDHICSK